MQLQLFQIDAFTSRVFGGNPAAVCPLEAWLDDDVLQRIAMENNLSETAFFTGGDGIYDLRWFTPTTEVDLCGHATLASAFVLFNELGERADRIRFESRSGPLYAERVGGGDVDPDPDGADDGVRKGADGRGTDGAVDGVAMLALDFPFLEGAPAEDIPEDLIEGLGAPPAELFTTPGAPNYYAIFESESEVRALRPHFDRLERLHPSGVVATAPGDMADCASRYFAPSYGIPEDPVTGSIHSGLTPYWSRRLGRPDVHAHQVSARGGELFCEVRGDRVRIAGNAVKYLEGWIWPEASQEPGASLNHLAVTAVDDDLPSDVAERHDDYLYGGEYRADSR